MATFSAAAAPRVRIPFWALALAGIVLAGAVLRLVWVRDIEYKWDEAWTFRQTQEVGRTSPFPWRGMPSSTGLDNPGMSLWIFLLLGKLFAVHEPTSLARAVQLLSIAGLGTLALFALRVVPRREREPWLWAVALLAVNPLAVLFHRKIWPPSVLPLFVALWLMCWWCRQRRVGAFAWGFLGVCMGQIHMGGFFLVAGFAFWAVLFDRRRVAWGWWLAGCVLGAVPLLPWLGYSLAEAGQLPMPHRNWVHVAEGRFWIRWVTEPLGFGLNYTLDTDFGDFLGYPYLAGRPSYLVGGLHGVLLVAGLCILLGAGRRLWRARGRWRELAVGRHSPTAFTQNAALWGFGLLLSLTWLPIHRHYMVIVYPLEVLWLARLALVRGDQPGETVRGGRALLTTLCVAQLLLSISFLSYVHTHPLIHGDYGVPYSAQQNVR
jgi:hypothetical protein